MVELIKHGVYLLNGKEIRDEYTGMTPDEARENTITYGILRAHDVDGAKGKKMRIRFDAMMSHDITYVGIIQTARASGLEEFPLPYAMTNCHNSLCAVGGTINEDDHVFGLSAAKKYGGIYVPANQAVIHQYAREMMVKCGNMILGSDSHTRYGSLGNMGVGEGGGELVKQLLRNTWDINAPEVVLVWLEGKPKKGVGPHDVAISLVKATFESGVVKNKVLEFAGPGVKELPIDFRNGIDIMTTETTCLSSIWVTDEEVKHHYDIHERPQDFKELKPGDVAYYDMMIRIDLSSQEAMIALPFHPSNAVTIHELQADPVGILTRIEEDAKKRFGDKVDVHLVDKVVDGKVFIDPDKCNRCGRCLHKCPFHVNEDYIAGYSIVIGGRWGKKVAMGKRIPKIFTTEEEVLATLEKTILFFAEQGQKGERLSDTIHRIGFEKVTEELLSDDILSRKDAIVGDALK